MILFIGFLLVTYSYAAGECALTITGNGGENQIVLVSGITSGDITLTAPSHDLLIMDGIAGDTITLKSHLTTLEKVQQIVFADGGMMSLDGAILTRVLRKWKSFARRKVSVPQCLAVVRDGMGGIYCRTAWGCVKGLG